MKQEHYIKITGMLKSILTAGIMTVTFTSFCQSTELKVSPPISNGTASLDEKVLLDYILTANTIKTDPKSGAPFDTLQYDKIIAYDFGGNSEETLSIINDQGNFVSNVFNQQALSQAQANTILAILTDTVTYGESRAICFSPRFALVFYKRNTKVNQINICLDCNYLISEIDIAAETYHLKKVADDGYIQTGSGFSESGRRAIIKFCKKLNFSYGSLEK